MIIAIDGNHFVGKTTIVDQLKEYYNQRDDIAFYKFPSHTPIGDFARQAVGKEADDVLSLLFCADYYNVYNDFIKANENKVLIFDRYVLTLFTLQGYMKNKDYDFLKNLCKRLPKPDIQIVINKKEQDDVINNEPDPFVLVLDDLNYFGDGTVYVVENILNKECKNESGYNQVKAIIDNAIASL